MYPDNICLISSSELVAWCG